MDIKNFENSLTLFYYKSNGKIKSYATGIQSMAMFGEFEEDYSNIIDFKIVEYDEFLINNYSNFIVTEEGLIYSPPAQVIKYIKA